ncbi:MAG: TolC family outer membrane protein [Burkholderiales bacterium]|nr:TolC family outer membrane protein [Burkholderiales bacterium]
MPTPRLRSPALAAALALALVAFLPAPAAAQSLIQLYDAAHAYDATYLAARSQYESAPFRVDQTRALLRPNLALGANAGRVEAFLDNSPNPTNSSYGVTVTGRQPIFNRQSSTTIAQSERSLVSSLADLDAAEQDLMLRVSQAYFDVLGAQDTLTTTRASKAAISEQLASAKRNFEVGTATITDTREAQARFDLATAQEIAAENDLVTKRIALDQLVGQTNVVPRQLAVPVVLPVPTASVDAYVSRAAEEHPAVRRALVAFEVAQLETEKARAQRLPTVDAVASVGNGRGLYQPGAFGQNTSIGLQLNMPLYSGGAIQNRIKETLALEERARNDLDAARRGVTQTTRQAYYTLLSGAAQVKALEAAEASSQLALEATQVGYRVGIRVNVDVLNAQSQLYQTRRDLARARYDVLLATLRLRQASGQLTPSDVLAIDRLLAP